MTTHRLVIGPGGSGRTHQLRTWLEEYEAGEGAGPVVWISASSIEAIDENELQQQLDDDAALLIVDDLQWLTDGALRAISQFGRTKPVWASRRPWPSSERLRLLDDQLTSREQAVRTVFLDIEGFGSFVASRQGKAAAGALVDALLEATGGSVGLGDDAIASSWEGDLDHLPEALIDAVMTRIRRSGSDSAALAAILAVEPTLEVRTAARALPPGVEARGAQRGLRSAGLTGSEGHLLPLVAAALLADLAAVEAEDLHDRIGALLGDADPERAEAHHLRASADNVAAAEALLASAERVRHRDPERALELLGQLDADLVGALRVALVSAEATFHLGGASVLSDLEASGAADSPRGVLLGFGLDLRDLRWSVAADRSLPSEFGVPLRALILAVVGQLEPIEELPPTTGPLVTMLNALVTGLAHLAAGDQREAMVELAAAVDDFDRLQPDLPLGFTPHLLASLVAVSAGDLAAAEDFAGLGVERASAGERTSLELQLAYVRLLDGRYADALTAVRAGEDEAWSGRDRLLLAVLDAALASRSGDTARLRDAWRRADPVLIRHTPSWLFIDPITELLAAGAKLGHQQRINPIVESLADQVAEFSPSSVVAANRCWLELQLGLASEAPDAVAAAAEALRMFTPGDARSQARVDAAPVWSQLSALANELPGVMPDEQVLVDVAAALADGGEGWEASRVVGQAALDVEEPAVARRLLERARAFSVEVDEADAEDPLVALGLSERESEVARLVSEGQTHKEVGAQLYISPKTVEHHVARIRQKLSAGSRAELLATIREAVGTEIPSNP